MAVPEQARSVPEDALMPRVCERITLHDDAGNVVGSAHITRDVRYSSCVSCGGRAGAAQCDFPLTGKRKGATCSKHLCARCSVRLTPAEIEKVRAAGVALASPDETDLCPAHARLVGVRR